MGFIFVVAIIDLLITGAIAKWAIFAPIFVPLMLNLGVAPEAVLAAYRVGDSPINAITPLNAYFALVVGFAQKYDKNAGVGTVVSLMLPYLDLWMVVGGGVFVFILLRQWGNPKKLVVPSWVAGPSIAAWAAAKDIALQLGNLQISALGEPPAMEAYGLKLGMIVLAALCLPALLQYYVRSGALERYTLRGLPTLVTYGRARRQVEVVRDVSERHRRATMETLRIAFLSSAALELLATISVAIVAVTVGLRLSHGSMELGHGLAFVAGP